MSELSDYFRHQAAWRREKAEEYPEDERNAQSARALESLADYIPRDEGCVVNDVLENLNRHLFEGSTLGGEQAAREASRYGYGYNVSPLRHVEFLEDLLVACWEDAYDFAGEHGEDWTESLFPCEVEAAKDGVYLPRRYWERRSHSAEHELEAAVAEYRADGEGE
jgi:hypothetical protein